MPTTKRKHIIKRRVDAGFKLLITAELTPDEEEGGYSVYCPELDIYTQAETIAECIRNLQEAAIGYIKVVGLEHLKLRQKPVIRKEIEVTVYA